MQLGVYATDNGPHDALTYAMMATDQIVQIEPNAKGPRRLAGDKLRMQLIEAFAPIFDEAIGEEVNKLKRNPKRMMAQHHEVVDEASAFRDMLFKAFLKIAEASEFKEHFAQEHVQMVQKQTLLTHVSTAMHERRSYHADENADHPEAQKFKATYHGREHPNVAFIDAQAEPKRSKAAEKAEEDAQKAKASGSLGDNA